MRTRSSSNLLVVSPSNPSTSNPKRRNRRRSKQPFILEESPIDTMADQRTMVELLRAPTEGYAEAIVVPPILAEQFELKHSLINMMPSDQFFRLEKDNPRDHIRWFNKITSIIKYKDVPNSAIKLMLFPFSLNNKSFQQRFDESFHEAWDRYKDLLRACPHHGFTELYQLDTFYNALNPADQDSLNAAAGGNLLERRTQDVLPIIENKSKCLAASGNNFLKLQDNIQGYVSAGAVNYNQGNSIYRPPEQSYQAPIQQNQIVPLNELEKVKRMNEANMKAMQTQINIVKNELRNEMKNSIQASLSNQTNEIKNMIASLFQMNTASTLGSGSLLSNTIANPKGELKSTTTRIGLVLDGPTIPTPPPFINPEEDERVEETLTDPDLSEYTIKVPPPPVQKYKPLSQIDYVVHQRDHLHPNILYSSRMLKQKQQEKDEVQIHKFWQMFKLLHINITLADALILMPKVVFVPVGKFTFPADFVIVDYESNPRVPLILGRPFLRTARALIEVHVEEMILHDGDERLT
nr:reverse transcriptase domain-containing protein [Tanacetum cinerariifolium]